MLIKIFQIEKIVLDYKRSILKESKNFILAKGLVQSVVLVEILKCFSSCCPILPRIKKIEKLPVFDQSHRLTLWKNAIFSTFFTSCFYCLRRRFFFLEYRKTNISSLFRVKNGHFYQFLDVRKSQERQASKKFYKKCSENSRSQIVFRTDIFRKLTLGAPDTQPALKLLFFDRSLKDCYE